MRRLAIVSLHAHRPLAPRGERTRRLAEGFARDWDVDLVAPSPELPTGGASGRGSSSRARRLGAAAVRLALLDKWEPWSIRRFRRWRADVDAAVLIGHPFSPPVYAARRLAAASTPYVVDGGDPWVLTNPWTDSVGVALLRARRAEDQMWSAAAGAVLTTQQQAYALSALFPGLPTLVRPNGYEPLAAPWPPAGVRQAADDELRLIHLGMLSYSRLDLRPFLSTLCDSGRWRRIVLAQFGDDFAGQLNGLPPAVEVQRHRYLPWNEVISRAANYDLALVVGNVNPAQLPSKAVPYLTLPIPRLAVTGSPDDALATYVRDMPGWLAVSPDDPEAAARLEQHLGRRWTSEQLRPPTAEAWPEVVKAVTAFVEQCVDRASSSSPAQQGRG